MTPRLQHLGSNTGDKGLLSAKGTGYNASVYQFRTTKGILYELDFNAAANSNYYGVIEVNLPNYTGTPAVVNDATVYATDSVGGFNALVSTPLPPAIMVDDVLTVRYTDTIDTHVRWRDHSFWLEGETLRIKVQATGTGILDYYSNYNGIFYGTTSSRVAEEVVSMPGTLAMHILQSTQETGKLFVSKVLDVFQSHASTLSLSDPDVTAVTALRYSTAGDYRINNVTGLQAGLNEEYFVTVSTEIQDCFVVNSDATTGDFFADLVKSPLILMTQNPSTVGGWTYYDNYYRNASTGWGFEDAYAMCFYHWTSLNYAGGQVNGLDWLPPGGDTGEFRDLMKNITGQDMFASVYTHWVVNNTYTPSFDFADIVLDATGGYVVSNGNQQVFIVRESAITGYMDGTKAVSGGIPEMVSEYGINSIFMDVCAYGGPHKGAGYSIDATSGAVEGTISGLINQRLTNLQYMRDTTNGPVIAEGSFSQWDSDMEFIWTPQVDGHQTWVNTNPKTEVESAHFSKTISKWYMCPNAVWAAQNVTQSNMANLPSRFFSQADFNEGIASPGQTTTYPYSLKMMDRIRCYEFLLGRPGTIFINQATGKYGDQYGYWSELREHIKEYYITRPLVSLSRDTSIPRITYFINGQEYTYEQALYTFDDQDYFIECKVKLSFANAHDVYINRSDEDWLNPIDIGTDISIPKDGYVSDRKSVV